MMAVRGSYRPFYHLCDLNTKLRTCSHFSETSYKTQFTMEDKPVEKAIQEKLKSRLNPIHLSILNESYMHNVPKGSETHFKVFVVSQEFENMALLGRHRLVNSILEEELQTGVHALSIVGKATNFRFINIGRRKNPKTVVKVIVEMYKEEHGIIMKSRV